MAAERSEENPLPEVLNPGQIARLFGVNPKTVTRWADAGQIPHFTTPGGHHRFRRDDILPLIHVVARQ